MDPDVVKIAQLLVVFGMFGAGSVVMWMAVKVLNARLQSKPQRPQLPSDDRLARLEQAIDTIAIEVERIAEAQRFSAKLMNERLPERIPASSESEPTR